MVFLVALVALVVPADAGSGRPLRDHCDRIELNHIVNAEGEVTLDQVIYWDFSPTHGYVVRSWRTHKGLSQSPYRASGKRCESFFHDHRDNCFRHVTAEGFIETWTDFDPETVNQAVVDRNARRELSVPVKRKGRK